MARYSVAVQKASGASAAWLMGLKTPATRNARVWEIGVFAESSVAGTLGLRRTTTNGTGAATTTVPASEDSTASTAVVLLDTAYATSIPTSNAVYFRRAALPAVIGAGLIWTFPTGIVIPVSASLQIDQISTAAVTYGVYWVYEE